MKSIWMVPLAVTAGALAFGPATAAVAADDATVVVVHGIPDTDVDVYVNDDLTLDNFTFSTVTDPLTLPAGDYAIAIRAADAEATADPILEADATLEAGDNVSIVAHLNADGDPVITPFANDVSNTSAGEGRLVVRHTAAAPAVDVLAGGEAVFSDLTNPNEEQADLAAATVSASVALAGTTDPVIGPADVPVVEGQATIVYAVGSAEAENLDVLVQTIDGLESAPASVDTGNSLVPGAATTSGSSSTTPLALGALLVVVAAVLGAATLRRRTAAE
jgi:hypothetical protein